MPSSFTRTEQRMLAVLADGQPHTREELHACLSDSLSGIGAVRRHISNLRSKLNLGEIVICELKNRRVCYRRARLLLDVTIGALPEQGNML